MTSRGIMWFCVFCGVGYAFAAATEDFPPPWAWWTPADAYDYASSGNIDYFQHVADRTGNGHVLNTDGSGGISVLTNDVLRGKCWSSSGTGGGYASFTCPAMTSRTFSIWVNAPNAQNGYGEADASPLYLLNNLSGLSITSPWGGAAVWTINARVATDLTWAQLPLVWNHVVVTVEDTGARSGTDAVCTVKLYVDGDCVGTQEDVAVPVTAGTSTIANNAGWSKHGIRSLCFDDVRVWTNALSAAEVQAVFKDGRKQKMIGHWPCDRIDVAGNGTRTTPDVSGMGAPLTIEALNSLTNGIDGTPALFFGAGAQTAAQEPFESMATAVNMMGADLRGDWTWAFWYKPDRLQYTPNGARLALFDGRYLMLGYQAGGNGIQIADAASSTSGGDTITLSNWRAEEWAHIVLSCRFARLEQGDGSYLNMGHFIVHQNGEKVFEGTPKTCGTYGFLPKDGLFRIGNFIGSGNDFRRPLRGTMDDIRLYTGRLTDDEIRALYKGPAAVSAGEDFAVSGETAELHGEVSSSPMARTATGYMGEPVWMLVSAPTGGEGASITNPKAASTRVTLPVEGVYVFALSNNVLGKASVDEVAVTRVASPASTLPTVTAAVGNQTGLCAVVSAEASAGARVRWTKTSGSGVASFGRATAAKTSVAFSQAGTYTLACTAETDAGTATAEVTLTVEGDSIDALLRQGLGCYWPFKIEQAKSQVDEVAGLTLGADYNGGKGMYLADGVADGYAIHTGDTTSRAITTQNGSYAPWVEYLDATTGSNGTPKEPFNTISCWLYHDSACTWPCWMGTICFANYSCGVHYLCDNGAANDFSIVQNKTSNQYHQRYRGPAGLNYTNRWIHFVAQLDNHGKGLSEVWVNGVRLEQTTHITMGAGRTCNSFAWGGQSCYAYPPNDLNASIADVSNKNFPGRIDELRMYRRHLSEAEIRYLYEHPVPNAVNDAPVIELPVKPVQLVARRVDGVAQVVSSDDGRPDGRLTYRWQVLEGNAGDLVFSEVADARPTVTALKPGVYTLQLIASDGVRTTYSDPIPVTVVTAGTVFIIR